MCAGVAMRSEVGGNMITETACTCGCTGCSEGNCCDHKAWASGFDDYQRGAAMTARGDIYLDPEQGRVAIAAMGLAGESGELIDHLKKWIGHGHAVDRDYITKELGDILWYVAEIASVARIDLSEVAVQNEKKLRLRYPKGFSVDRSVNRSEHEKDSQG
jgi:NTP pyrophosphatase (non-canonical NTP hydrolase)